MPGADGEMGVSLRRYLATDKLVPISMDFPRATSMQPSDTRSRSIVCNDLGPLHHRPIATLFSRGSGTCDCEGRLRLFGLRLKAWAAECRLVEIRSRVASSIPSKQIILELLLLPIRSATVAQREVPADQHDNAEAEPVGDDPQCRPHWNSCVATMLAPEAQKRFRM
jgi:hypothetical protein